MKRKKKFFALFLDWLWAGGPVSKYKENVVPPLGAIQGLYIAMAVILFSYLIDLSILISAWGRAMSPIELAFVRVIHSSGLVFIFAMVLRRRMALDEKKKLRAR